MKLKEKQKYKIYYSFCKLNRPLLTIEIYQTYLSENYSEQTKLVLDRPKSDVDERKAAVTKYRVIDSNNKAALLEIQPETGKLLN